MKSAYERALDRFGPVNELSEAVKAQIAEVDNLYRSKIAAVEVGYQSKIVQAGTPDDIVGLQQEMGREINVLKEKSQREKDEIRSGV